MADVSQTWTFESSASAERLWEVFADTDAFNRSAALGLRFEVQAMPDGTIQRTGSVTRFGTQHRWHERPFAFERPRWFRTERQFIGGPATALVARCDITDLGETRRVTYTLTLTPRFGLARPFLEVELRAMLGPSLGNALKHALRTAETAGAQLDPPAPPLTQQQSSLLQSRLLNLERPTVGRWLSGRIHSAPLRDLKQLRPAQAAEELDLPLDTTLRAFLEACRAGVLELTWGLMCPACHAEKRTLSSLSPSPTLVHCDSCNIRFDATFADSVAATFRPAPDIRLVNVPVDCLLGPGSAPHVAAQATIPAQSSLTLATSLTAGTYRLLPSNGELPTNVEVRSDAVATTTHLHLTPSGLHPGLIRLQPGEQSLVVENRTGREAFLRVASTARVDPEITAGQLLSLGDVLDLLPKGALSPTVVLERKQGVVVSVEVRTGDHDDLDRVLHHLDAHLPIALVRTRDTAASRSDGWAADLLAQAVFTDLNTALLAVRRLTRQLQLAVGIAGGLCLVLASEERRLLLGDAAEQSLHALRAGGGGRVALSPAVLDSAAFTDWLDLHSAEARLEQRGAHCVLHLAKSPDHPALFATPSQTQPDALLAERFAVIGPIGGGAMGHVFAATDIANGAPVALKLLDRALSQHAQVAQHFFNESALVSRVHHPRVIRLLDYGTDRSGQLWMAMERLTGESLAERLQRGPLDADATRELVRDLLSALSAVHAAGIVHRDLKPANIFFEHDGGAKLLDFGIALEMWTSDPFGGDGGLVGTPVYLSPEQARGELPDGRSDLYSLALVAWTCLTGRRPYDELTPTKVAKLRLDGPPPDFEDVLAAQPADLQRVLRGAWTVLPDARFPTAKTMASELRPKR